MQKTNTFFNKKIIFMNLLALSTLPVGFVLSCNNDKTANQDYKTHWDKFNGFKTVISKTKVDYPELIKKAKILDWKDGDTVSIVVFDEKTKKWGTKKENVRIASIDTPEYHNPNAKDRDLRGNISDFELKWAIKATEWAEAQLPVGTEVLVWKSGVDGYGRWVGSIFYGEDFKENFSVNIIKNGFSLPRVDKDTELLSSMTNIRPWKILRYLQIPLLEAHLYALRKKLNLYGLSESDLKKAHKMHGIPGNVLPDFLIKKGNWKKFFDDKTWKEYKIYNL